jgi:hypothetical protein
MSNDGGKTEVLKMVDKNNNNNNENDTKDKKEEDLSEIEENIDGGWAWVILICCFVSDCI